MAMNVKHGMWYLFYFIFDQPVCPCSILIIEWWSSNIITEDTGKIDSFP